MNWVSAFGGVVQYEFRMQLRRRSVWIALLGLGLLTLLVAVPAHFVVDRANLQCLTTSASDAAVSWTLAVNTLLPLAFGILLADRLPRDESLRIDTLFAGLPANLGLRLLGKYVGATLATAIPILLIFALGVDYIVSTWGSLSPALIALPAFVAINAPGLLFVAAFSLVCPLFMPVPVYQVLFTGYWFWGNLLAPNVFDIPTLNGTLLTPIGEQRAGYFFRYGTRIPVTPDLGLGVASVVTVTLCAAVALVAAWGYLRWRHERA